MNMHTKKLAIIMAAILLISALPSTFAQTNASTQAQPQTITHGKLTLTFSQNGVTVTSSADAAQPVSLECGTFLRMVSKAYPIPFEQADDVSGMVQIQKKSYQDSRYGAQYIHPEALEALEALISDAKDAGFKRTRLVETYRSSAIQEKRFQESLTKRLKQGMDETSAYEAAHLVTALPGESEHHLGQTLDILQRGDSMGQSFSKTKFAKWLAQNASSYGFIVRYPDGLQEITGISYEPWHLRFVGKPFALVTGVPGVCMETFYASLKTSRFVTSGDSLIVYVPSGGSALVSPTLASSARFSEIGDGGRVLVV